MDRIRFLLPLVLPALAGALPLAAFLGGAMLARSGVITKTGATRLAAIGGALGGPLAIVLCVLASTRAIAPVPGAIGTMLAFVPFAILTAMLRKARSVPRINDVSTDVADPPEFIHATEIPEHKGRDFTYPEKARALVPKWYPDLKSVVLPGAPDDVFDRARRAAHAMPRWAIAAADPKTRTIEASEESGLFGYVDDVVIRVRASATGQGSCVDVRSRSRDGIGDFGVNAARIRAYLARLQSPV